MEIKTRLASASDSTRLIIAAGFSIVLILMTSLMFLAINQMQSISDSMSAIVENTNAKIQSANEMRDTIRIRADSLKTMLILDDPFEKDDELQRFISISSQYRIARERLVELGMNPQETDIHNRLTEQTRIAQPFNEHAAELLMSDTSHAEIRAVIDQAIMEQAVLLMLLEELVELETNNAHESANTNARHVRETRNQLIALTGAGLFIAITIAYLVIRRATKKSMQMSFLAEHDSLTGLINRNEFENRLADLVHSAANNNTEHALLYLDLDQFKIVNDTCGHVAGDKLLCHLTGLLSEHVRQSDTLARLGGDEFGVLLRNCSLKNAADVAEVLRNCVQDFHFSWERQNFQIGASIGIVAITNDCGDIHTVLSAADAACYQAKDRGRNRVHIFDRKDRSLSERHGEMVWVSRLRESLLNDRFQLYFQTIVPINPNESTNEHIEILLRLIGDDNKVIMPGAFMPAAERYNLMQDIDRWVIENTFDWLAINRDACANLTVAINLSGHSISDDHMLSFIIDKVRNCPIDPRHLCWEITETAAVSNLTEAKRFMLILQEMGCSFALDDFGSGLSSFAYLKNLPADVLKIDGVFVKDIAHDPIDLSIVRSINELAHVTGKKTVAEFVENDAILQKLRSLGVDYAQGFGIAKPKPLNQWRSNQLKLESSA